jgi:hypothetical protein
VTRTRCAPLGRTLTLVLAVVALLLGFGGTASAELPDPAAPAGPTTVSISSAEGRPGDNLTVTGSGFPARITVQASTCGNEALRGSVDCAQAGAGATVTNADGAFRLDMKIGEPPAPCPCVINVISPDSQVKVAQRIVVVGQPVAPLENSTTTRTAEATSRLTGSGPLSAWFGGTAKRTYELTVTNTGSVALVDPRVTVTGGKGSDPTGLIAQPQIGQIAPGETVVFEIPVAFTAPTFGEYRVRATFGDLDTTVVTTATTSTYPYALIVVLWLLLQPLLLGLYKRRPNAGGETESDDPLVAPPSAPQPAALAVGAGLAGAAAAAAPTPPSTPAPYVAPSGTAIAVRTPSALVDDYRPVFGVQDLRSYLGTDDAGPTQVAPRIVLGGIVPVARPAEPAPPANGSDPAAPPA